MDALSDEAGNVVEAYLYDAYGTPTCYTATGAPQPGGTSVYDNRYLFQGSAAYEWLAQASLYYCQARMYLPAHGRWLQPDPIGQAGGLNLYGYCHNDPINAVDPSGLAQADPRPKYPADRFSPPTGLNPNGFKILGYDDDDKGRGVFIRVDNNDGTTGYLTNDKGVITYSPPSMARGAANGALMLWLSLNPMAAGLMGSMSTAPNADDNVYTASGWNRESITQSTILYAPMVISLGLGARAVYASLVEEAAAGAALGEGAALEGSTARCFVAGTQVLEPGGAHAIEAIRVGERVCTAGDEGPDGSTQVDPATWQEVTLRLRGDEASWDEYEIHALRSPQWLAQAGGTRVGDRVWFELAEQGLRGWAEVRDVAPCPALAAGPGRVVLTTFSHWNTDVRRLWIEGQAAPLEVTGLHPLYSASRGGWVRVRDLAVGERLRTRTGEAAVVGSARRPGTFRVFNLEVEEEHCYFVGDQQMLAHNACGLGGRLLSAAEQAEFDAFGNRAQALGLIENPNRTGSWGRIGASGKYVEVTRIDVAEAGKPGYRGVTHMHVAGPESKVHAPLTTNIPGE